MQTSPETTEMSTHSEQGMREDTRPSSSSCSSSVGREQDEVALLLEEAQEQLRALALAHRKQEEGSGLAAVQQKARETVCFLNHSGGGSGGLSCNGPTQTQLLNSSQSHRDLGPNDQ